MGVNYFEDAGVDQKLDQLKATPFVQAVEGISAAKGKELKDLLKTFVAGLLESTGGSLDPVAAPTEAEAVALAEAKKFAEGLPRQPTTEHVMLSATGSGRTVLRQRQGIGGAK